ncbi:hypothetical protein Pcinc_037760 [Petrolisthes cinctipes]|uniref:Leucine-rich melanocyte differentiation-associated protein-like n=1 Tax=Petrolisthes cinctipes TaxID=88211 RepID=A0AAE1BVV2_PETCI|nr:hypothetical protein Pcinc_037760 [Petrolisthes cinctipes]
MAISLHVNDFSIEKRTPTLHLCFVGQDCQRIPSILGATYGLQTKRLDLSYNAIRSLDGLDKFPFLEELILDNNFIDDSVVIPRLPTLHTLSLNKNKVTDLERLLDQICERLPNLRYLSLLGNEACPDQLTSADKDEKDYRCYRLYVLHRMPRLKFLDSSAVRRREVTEAKKRGALAKTIRVTPPTPHKDGRSVCGKQRYTPTSLCHERYCQREDGAAGDHCLRYTQRNVWRASTPILGPSIRGEPIHQERGSLNYTPRPLPRPPPRPSYTSRPASPGSLKHSSFPSPPSPLDSLPGPLTP